MASKGRMCNGSAATPRVKGATLSDYESADYVVGAIRLAIEGAANAEVALEVIETLCGYAGPTDPDSTIPTKLFVDAIRALDGTFALNQKVTA